MPEQYRQDFQQLWNLCLMPHPSISASLRITRVTNDARALQGDRRLEEQLATLLESRMEMDAEWSAMQAQAAQPQVGLPSCRCAAAHQYRSVPRIQQSSLAFFPHAEQPSHCQHHHLSPAE